MSSKIGRPLGRPRSRASFLGHPGASPEKAGPAFPPPPAPPSSTTALGCDGLLTLTLRGKAMDGLEEQQERNRPQLSPPSLENRRTDAGFPQRQQAGGAPSRGFARPLLFTTNGTYNRQQSDAGNTINPSTKSGQAQPVAPRGEPSAHRATLGASTTPQPDVRPFPPTDARDSSASPPFKPPSGGSHLPPSPPLPQPPAKGNPYWTPIGRTLPGILTPAS